MGKEIKNPSQEQKILNVLKEAQGNWVSGQKFLNEMLISQYHARIFNLQKKGYLIEGSEKFNDQNFKSYRLLTNNTLF